jgi:carbonic anhydrase/acetyltransferase-like protein (isoleucine patch superfamily)
MATQRWVAISHLRAHMIERWYVFLFLGHTPALRRTRRGWAVAPPEGRRYADRIDGKDAAMRSSHLGAHPRIHPDAVVASTAVISGDVTVGAGCQVLHGAILTAEGSPVVVGENTIVMENALVRASSTHAVHIGPHTLIGPMASVAGADIGTGVFLATGTRIFNGAKIGDGSEVRINAVVHVRAVLPAGTVVPISWVAVGDPLLILPPDRHEEIWAAQKELDFPGYVFGLDRETPGLMVQLTERYGRSLSRHAADRLLD